jgi:putative FmdB family regulatory protein
VPTYQYACTECDHSFEQFQSFTENALTICPECEGRLRKVFNAVGVVFKGSGFYRTDSRKDSTSGRTGASEGTTGGSSSGSSNWSASTTKTSSETSSSTKTASSSAA